VTYGGYRHVPSAWRFTLARVLPGDVPLRCDTFNANCVLVSGDAEEKLGILDRAYFHSFGDIDYGLRATHAGVPVWLAPGTIGTCEVNTKKISGGWGDAKLSIRQRWKILRTPKGLDPASWFRLMRRHGGALWPVTALMPYRYLLGFSIGKNAANS
jgi:GT2 family glycosyltransferase